jgi:predicted nucleic-acid-binding protein
MKDAKVKVVDKCITVANKVVEIFINQNSYQHSPSESILIKTVYYYTPNKKILSEEQCSIMSTLLKNGLKVFETLHDYNFHQ